MQQPGEITDRGDERSLESFQPIWQLQLEHEETYHDLQPMIYFGEDVELKGLQKVTVVSEVDHEEDDAREFGGDEEEEADVYTAVVKEEVEGCAIIEDKKEVHLQVVPKEEVEVERTREDEEEDPHDFAIRTEEGFEDDEGTEGEDTEEEEDEYVYIVIKVEDGGFEEEDDGEEKRRLDNMVPRSGTCMGKESLEDEHQKNTGGESCEDERGNESLDLGRVHEEPRFYDAQDACWPLDYENWEEEEDEKDGEEEEEEEEEEEANIPRWGWREGYRGSRRRQRGHKYGQLREIREDEYVREVTCASEWVIVVLFLYKNGIPMCNLVESHLSCLAVKFPETKFLKILSTECVPNYPDSHLPTMFIYSSGCILSRLIGEAQCGGQNVLEEEMKCILASSGAFVSDSYVNVYGEDTLIMTLRADQENYNSNSSNINHSDSYLSDRNDCDCGDSNHSNSRHRYPTCNSDPCDR